MLCQIAESTSCSLEPALLAECVAGACNDLTPWSVPWAAQVDVKTDFPTIGAVSRHFTLNLQQHKAFVLMSACLLEGLLGDVPEDKEPLVTAAHSIVERILVHNDETQLRFFLSGPAGTGKSRVINALVDFARRWKCADSLVLTATSGIASVLIQGQTYHSYPVTRRARCRRRFAREAQGHSRSTAVLVTSQASAD